MSASSSSECECNLHYNNYRTYTPIHPLYPELAHPLVYYAQVPKKQKQSEKLKNNCFVKAFRWYTEEHVPLKKIESGTNKEDIQGFAAWLDQKYDEFIRKNPTSRIASSQFLLKQASMVRINKTAQNIGYETLGQRRNKMKSPWRRRQKYSNRLNGDTIKKSDQSIEIILNAKSLSRSASECCQNSRYESSMIMNISPDWAQNWCHRSNNAINVDGNKPKTLKSKSESIIYILKEEEMYVVPFDNETTVTDKKSNDKMDNIRQLKNKKRQANNLSCQCSIMKLGKADASSQFSQNKTSTLCGCVKSYTNISNEKTTNFNKCCPCTESHSGMCQRVLKEEQNNLQAIRPSAVSQKSVSNTHSVIIPRETSFFTNKCIGKNEPSFSVNGIAQTSDHAINIFNVVNAEYPIFLKIICVDK